MGELKHKLVIEGVSAPALEGKLVDITVGGETIHGTVKAVHLEGTVPNDDQGAQLHSNAEKVITLQSQARAGGLLQIPVGPGVVICIHD